MKVSLFVCIPLFSASLYVMRREIEKFI